MRLLALRSAFVAVGFVRFVGEAHVVVVVVAVESRFVAVAGRPFDGH